MRLELISNPETYNIWFCIASLLLIVVVLIIHVSEEVHSNKQKQIFGMIISDDLILNTLGGVLGFLLFAVLDYIRRLRYGS